MSAPDFEALRAARNRQVMDAHKKLAEEMGAGEAAPARQTRTMLGCNGRHSSASIAAGYVGRTTQQPQGRNSIAPRHARR